MRRADLLLAPVVAGLLEAHESAQILARSDGALRAGAPATVSIAHRPPAEFVAGGNAGPLPTPGGRKWAQAEASTPPPR